MGTRRTGGKSGQRTWGADADCGTGGLHFCAVDLRKGQIGGVLVDDLTLWHNDGLASVPAP